MQSAVLDGLPGADFSIAVVWLPMLWSDVGPAADFAASGIRDARVRHFHDPQRRVGEAIAHSLGWPMTAWDVYLLYDKGLIWETSPPPAADWMHQIGGVAPAHYRRGDVLGRDLRGAIEQLSGR